MLHRIYVIRHGETVDFAENFAKETKSPTGNFADVELSLVGTTQSSETARKLASENLPIDFVYSSPHFQCLETLRPIVTNSDGQIVHMVRIENGLREWEDIDDVYPLCTSQCNLKRPTMLSALEQHFSYIDPNYRSLVKQPPGGWVCEPPRRLLLRAHFLIHHLILSLDPLRKPTNILLCTHAPVALALARILTATKIPLYYDFEPEYGPYFGEVRRIVRHIAKVDFTQPDHKAGYCSISRYERRKAYEWTWTMSMNGSQSHLSVANGPWRFRPSPWQNRHSPHPVLWACFFVRRLPESLLWGPRAALFWTTNEARELGVAVERQLRNNPYRLPAWVYAVLFCALITAVANRIVTLDDQAHLWVHADANMERTRRAAWMDALGNVCGGLVQFSLFMFPPLLA